MGFPTSKQHGKGKKAPPSSTHTTINTGFEIRKIVLARGVEGTDKDLKDRRKQLKKKLADWEHKLNVAIVLNDTKAQKEAKEWVDWLKEYIDIHPMFLVPNDQGKIMHKVPLTDRGSSHAFRYEYINSKQEVIYRLKVVQTKREFKKWLETPGIMVIYAGHSRYGRGACFGDMPAPGDRWEDGSGCTINKLSTDDGLLRLGFEFVGIPITDIHHHHYHTKPFRGLLKINAKTCHPEITKSKPIRKLVIDPDLDISGTQKKNHVTGSHESEWGYWKWDSQSQCIRIKPTFDLKSMFYKDDPTQGTLWGYRKKRYESGGGKWRLQIVLNAGWKNTVCKPWDLSNCNFEMALFATQTEVFFNQSSMHLFSLLFQNVLDTEACNGYKRVNTHPLLPKASQGHAIARTRRKPHPT
ncbi:hypothetical protein [Desulfosarcina ovata]|uniref:Uncharacterized protein n=1 Tax=Desulfosarcina ovata subsp. ovata TaxID=2752305 RepID=A0A5K8A7A1_9BACT|nr:hypothetical protein [Desulfosarcina ovata]BBO88405.1 hypothetical protein DSCOOX_15850 [Desulfosarcina ovata subsp. ovata]